MRGRCKTLRTRTRTLALRRRRLVYGEIGRSPLMRHPMAKNLTSPTPSLHLQTTTRTSLESGATRVGGDKEAE